LPSSVGVRAFVIQSRASSTRWCSAITSHLSLSAESTCVSFMIYCWLILLLV
jgi:hypothetical protein